MVARPRRTNKKLDPGVQGFVGNLKGEEGGDHLTILWVVFRATFPKHANGYDNLKLMNRIGAKLEAISTEKEVPEELSIPCAKCGNKLVINLPDRAPEYELKKGNATLTLEVKEWDKLCSMAKDPGTEWRHGSGVKAEAAIEWLLGLEQTELR